MLHNHDVDGRSGLFLDHFSHNVMICLVCCFFSSFHFANPAEVRFQKLRWVKSGRVFVQACDDVPKIPLAYLIISRAHDLYAVFFQHAAACGIHTDFHDC